jgi:succinyl-diaminopimelate desuccinylase
MTKKVDPIEMAQALIRCQSVTPHDDGALDLLEETLTGLGFSCIRLPFSQEGTPTIDNLYARRGDASPNLCFAGHSDVVPVGNADAWADDPFAATIRDGKLFGRGSSDMKGAVAAFVAAASRQTQEQLSGSLSLLITGDEEGPAINGTRKMLEALAERDEVINYCIVGEPTNPNTMGEMIKIGRRGSMNVRVTVNGVQGHVAYPHLAENPVPQLVNLLTHLKQGTFDDGTEYFQPSNLEVTALFTDAQAHNVIAGTATALLNARFSDLHTGDAISKTIVEQLNSANIPYDINIQIKGEAFLQEPGPLSAALSGAVEARLGKAPELSTTGGTSDARYIKNYADVAEFGLVGKTMHAIDEHVLVEDIEALADVYEGTITRILGQS